MISQAALVASSLSGHIDFDGQPGRVAHRCFGARDLDLEAVLSAALQVLVAHSSGSSSSSLT